MVRRRDVLKLALGTVGWLATGCRRQSSPVTQTSGKPRYWVQLLLSGGHDTVYTTDPKFPSEVDPMVTLPHENRVWLGGETRFGTSFLPLARHASNLTVLNAVQTHTANHDTGQKQFVHLKTNITDGMPTALDVIASHRSGQPLGVAYLNMSQRSMHSPRYFGTADRFYFGGGDVFDEVANAKPDELVALAGAMRNNARKLRGASAPSREIEQSAAYMLEAADFFEKVSVVPTLQPQERSSDYVAQTMSEEIERTLWLIEHDLTCGVILDLGNLGWDTHIQNDAKQTEMNGLFATYFGELLDGLAARKNARGSLADQTVVMAGSELGRFPRQNDMLGKDHLPQTAFMFSGPGFRAGRSFGRTGRRMEGLPISYTDGAHVESGRLPLLDDIGATMLYMAGIDPERYGFSGHVCNFMLDAA